MYINIVLYSLSWYISKKDEMSTYCVFLIKVFGINLRICMGLLQITKQICKAGFFIFIKTIKADECLFCLI